MKTIGLIGGVSWVSTIEYYRVINEEVNKRLGGIHSARCIVYSVDLGEIKRLQDRGDWSAVAEILTGAARSLERAGADFVLLCANTLHKVADLIEESINVPFIHIVDAVAEALQERGITKVGLLGTRFTMEDGFYGEQLRRRGIEAVIPCEEDRVKVDDIIYRELCRGVVRESSKDALKIIVDRLVEKGARGVVLGCTELPLLVRQSDVEVPVFDTTRIHAMKAVEYSIGEPPP